MLQKLNGTCYFKTKETRKINKKYANCIKEGRYGKESNCVWQLRSGLNCMGKEFPCAWRNYYGKLL